MQTYEEPVDNDNCAEAACEGPRESLSIRTGMKYGKETTMAAERSGAITFKGNPMTLVGNEVKVGDAAPDFVVTANDLSPVTLSDSDGKVRLFSVVPSLDTAVCDTQTRRFNQEAVALGDDVEIITVSMDLPFAQKRWCGAAGVDRVTTVSDYKDRSFGENWGLYIKELGLLARSIFVVDRTGTVKYIELVAEGTNEPDYKAAIAAAKSVV